MRIVITATGRARKELGWRPRYSSAQALAELIEGMGRREGMPTPPLSPDKSSATA
jgi:hypothetical protein